MASEFSEDVQRIVGPALAQLGFVLDEIDDRPEEGGGRPQHVVYYRSADCKIQVYRSAREGETNCMIAPLDAPNEFGLNAKKWRFLVGFMQKPDLPPDQLLRWSMAEYRAYANPLDWVKAHVTAGLPTARAAILRMYDGPGQSDAGRGEADL